MGKTKWGINHWRASWRAGAERVQNLYHISGATRVKQAKKTTLREKKTERCVTSIGGQSLSSGRDVSAASAAHSRR